MKDDFPGNDPKKVWQSQKTEPSTMTLKMFRQRARELKAKTRRELFGNLALGLMSLAISASGLLRARELGLQLVFALAFLWASAGLYFLHRGMWSRSLPEDAALSTGLAFYRQELKRRRSLLRRVLQWSFGPAVLSISALLLVLTGIAGRRGLGVRAVMPTVTLFAIWIVAFLILELRGSRELRLELAELADIENEGSQ